MDAAKFPTGAASLGDRPLQQRLGTDRATGKAIAGRPCNMTLSNFLLKRWLPLVEVGLEPTTTANYRSQIENYLVPSSLGNLRISQIRKDTLQEFYATLLRSRTPRKNGYFSKTTVIRLHALIHHAFEDLVRDGHLAHNPAHRARPRMAKSERYEYTIWTEDELREFLRFVSLDDLFALWHTLAFTGLRRGEALGLRRHDLRLAQRQLSVRRSLALVDGRTYLTRPKTDRERVIELDDETVRILRRHLRNKKSLSKEGWVFPATNGHAVHPGWVSRRFHRLVAQTTLPRIRLHDLRHTHASHLILAGANVKAVQERLGHSDVVVTLNIYSHVLPTTQREAVRQLERFYKL